MSPERLNEIADLMMEAVGAISCHTPTAPIIEAIFHASFELKEEVSRMKEIANGTGS